MKNFSLPLFSSQSPFNSPLLMGILNITPDSFSDGGKFFTAENLRERLNFLVKEGMDLIDIGAESTAPANQPISFEEEKRRFKTCFIPYLDSHPWPENVFLSIDTYRLDTFQWIKKILNKNFPSISLIWNDVAGILDDKLCDYLVNEGHSFYYVFGHTLVSDRNRVLEHMNFLSSLQGEEFFKFLSKHFKEAADKFHNMGIEDRIIFDPCFGLSKTKEQNQYLLQHLSRFIKQFSSGQKWLIGISRKSFLRAMCSPSSSHGHDASDTNIKHPLSIEKSERIHTYLLSKWAQELKEYPLIFRIHDPSVGQSVMLLKENYPFRPEL